MVASVLSLPGRFGLLMPPKGNLLRNLQQLEQGSSAERRAAQLKRQSQGSGEILQAFLAYRVADVAKKMALGLESIEILKRSPEQIDLFGAMSYPSQRFRSQIDSGHRARRKVSTVGPSEQVNFSRRFECSYN